MINRLIVLLLLASNGGALLACTNLLVSRGASTDSSTMVTYAADSHLMYGELYFRPSEDYPKGDSVAIYDWETGKNIGRIAQVEHTYQVVGNINEHQLVIAETTFSGKPELRDTTGQIDYGSLIYTTLQRAKTAREAIHIMDALLTEYGYYSTGESFSIADTEEVWIMELIGKGVGNKGAVWVARRIPDGYISGHANQARITTFPLNDPEHCLYSKDVIRFAKEKGYFVGDDSEFSFRDAYAPLDFAGARWCEARVWSAFRRVNSSMEQYEGYAMGVDLDNEMPLWIKPDKKLDAQDVMGLMRDYYGGTKMDMTQDVGAGPYSCIVRWRPLTWEVDSVTYFNERAISTQQTAFSFVSQSRGWLPDPIGGILWFGVDDTYSTVYTPMYCSMQKVPYGFAVGTGGLMEFDPEAAFWIFNQVSNFAYTRYGDMIPYIQELQDSLESSYLEQIHASDKGLLTLYDQNPNQVAAKATLVSTQMAEQTLESWKHLYAFLFTRYMDGNIKTPVKGQQNPDLEQPGYGEQWYRQIIDNTGGKFKYQSTNSH